jgi:hypothetical protein
LENGRAHYYARREHVILDDHETRWDTMKVNKKLAAQMVGPGRTTFYRHIEEKPISVLSDGFGNESHRGQRAQDASDFRE